jgi:hypothetical protein
MNPWHLWSPSRGLLNVFLLPERISNFDETKVNLCVFSSISCIVLANFVFIMEIEVSLEPLDEFEVVLVLALAELFNIDIFLYFALGKCLLENLVVVDKLPLVAGMPIDSLHSHLSWEHGIDYVTINCAAAKLLDLCDLQTKGGIHPSQKITLGHEEGSFHHANTLLF